MAAASFQVSHPTPAAEGDGAQPAQGEEHQEAPASPISEAGTINSRSLPGTPRAVGWLRRR